MDAEVRPDPHHRQVSDDDQAVLDSARRWRASFLHHHAIDLEQTYQLVTDLEVALRAKVEDFPVA
jgi:hypothetical protein